MRFRLSFTVTCRALCAICRLTSAQNLIFFDIFRALSVKAGVDIDLPPESGNEETWSLRFLVPVAFRAPLAFNV